MGCPHDGHSWVRRTIRMRAASLPSKVLRSVRKNTRSSPRRRALPSPQAAVEWHSIRLPHPARPYPFGSHPLAFPVVRHVRLAPERVRPSV
jgi:hypothetical protein